MNTVILNSMSEKELQDNVIDLAHALGYLVHAERPAMNLNHEWRTPIQGDKGFPDLVLVSRKQKSIIFAELKSEKGKLFNEQAEWRIALMDSIIPNSNYKITYYEWRPSDWFSGKIE
jgi:hypothetical protein